MTAQRHWIQRQLFDVTVADQVLGKRLHDELSRLQETRIEALIDRCCSEFSAPDRVHRIGRIELELGELSIQSLEQELLEKLDNALRKTLGAKIREDEQLSVMIGEDPVVMAHVELISLFARTATLPFWADESRPGLVDDAVQKVLMTDARALVVLVQQLLQDTRALERLVRHVQPERLRALFEVVANASLFDGATRAAELWTLLAMSSTLSNSIPKTTLWIAALETVNRADVRGDGAIGFFREVLGRVALSLGKPYRSIVEAFYRAMGTRGDKATGVLGGVLRELADEVVGKKELTSSDISDSPLSTQRSGVGEGGRGGEVPEKVSTTWGDDGKHPEEKAGSSFDDAPDVSILGARGAPNSPAPRAQTVGPRRTAPRIRAAQGSPNVTSVTSSPGRPAFDVTEVSSSPARPAFDVTEVSSSPARPAFDVTEVTSSPARPAFDVTEVSSSPARPAFDVTEVSSTADQPVKVQPVKVPTTFADRPQRSERPLARQPSTHLHETPDQIYLDTAGLVLLWPFLGTFFERLEWLFDKKTFIDETARSRAVLLVQYLATTDPDPPEYRLPLAKVLCGMPLDDVFVMDTEVTEVEAKEADDLLVALLEHAKTLGEISIADFRDAFLLRRGVLSTRDGSWLLRVERSPYDAVLQRLPWPLTWVRFPWMEAPLAVEWLR